MTHLCEFNKCFHCKALQELNELYEAVFAAEKAVELDPTWAVARQTLGRAQLGIGELDLVCI